ncbi:uncharacterized protein LOC114241245 [Bombyx mandarina]|uniref:Uncharacterized protein LOC114241245 n=1 Tax=Bombyx mandarina TaxID=7092 RepID=A0A6J2JEB9_BOMMA|nr:uncharacterized protein LOC114241245 [Bombyx mandarina]
MLVQTLSTLMYTFVFLSLFLVDYLLGNGFVDMFQTIFCKIACFVKKTLREEAKKTQLVGKENPISIPVIFIEILVLSLTIAFLNKYKKYRAKDRIDELLNESKEAIRQTNEFLEKWRLRRVSAPLMTSRKYPLDSVSRLVPTDFSYLDEEPQEIKPLKLEVPILHMAIIDTLGTTRSLPESGDAGDTFNITDSTLLSVTSLLEDDLESIPDPIDDKLTDESNHIDMDNRFLDRSKSIEFNSRFLWDVVEEDEAYE